jgi:hypothetical protein
MAQDAEAQGFLREAKALLAKPNRPAPGSSGGLSFLVE